MLDWSVGDTHARSLHSLLRCPPRRSASSGASLASMTAADMGVVCSASRRRRAIRDSSGSDRGNHFSGMLVRPAEGRIPPRQISIRSGVSSGSASLHGQQGFARLVLKSIALWLPGNRDPANLDCVLGRRRGSPCLACLIYLDGARLGLSAWATRNWSMGCIATGFFFCPMAKMLMGETAEVLSRAIQDYS